MSLHVEVYGQGEPLVMLHGWGMHGGMWGDVVAKLAETNSVHVVDLPGHGFNAGEGQNVEPQLPYSLLHSPYSLDSITEALCAEFSHPITLCGWSLGGQIALHWARRDPQKIQRLILVSSTPYFVRQGDWDCAMEAETLAGFAAALTENYAMTLRRFLALQVRGSEGERELLASLRTALFSRGEPDLAALQAGLNILRDSDQRKELASIEQATLIIAGERDTLTPLAASAYMANKMPNARLAEIKGAAHAPFLSHPEIFVQHIKDFMYG